MTEILGVRKQGAVSAPAHSAALVGKAAAPLSGWQERRQQPDKAVLGTEVTARALPCYSSCSSPQCRGMGERKWQHWMSLKQPRQCLTCSGRAQGHVWELRFHTALGGSLLINLKLKLLIVSCISTSLALPHQQWQWAALKPNGQNRVLAEQNVKQQSCPHLFPSIAVWARLPLCIPFSQMGLSLPTADHFCLWVITSCFLPTLQKFSGLSEF